MSRSALCGARLQSNDLIVAIFRQEARGKKDRPSGTSHCVFTKCVFAKRVLVAKRFVLRHVVSVTHFLCETRSREASKQIICCWIVGQNSQSQLPKPNSNATMSTRG